LIDPMSRATAMVSVAWAIVDSSYFFAFGGTKPAAPALATGSSS
jgi:hypothetical protein